MRTLPDGLTVLPAAKARTKQQILAALKAAARKLGHPPTSPRSVTYWSTVIEAGLNSKVFLHTTRVEALLGQTIPSL